MSLTNKKKYYLKNAAIGVGIGLTFYLTSSSCYKLGKVYGAVAMRDLTADKLQISLNNMPSVFKAAGVKL